MPLCYMERKGSLGGNVYVLPNCSNPARTLRQEERGSEGLRKLESVVNGREADADVIAFRFDAPDAFGSERVVKMVEMQARTEAHEEK